MLPLPLHAVQALYQLKMMEAEHKHKHKDDIYTLQGNCAELPADRTTEFHGNPMTSNLNLAMAGNQSVVFDHFMQAFNEHRDARGRGH